MEIGEVIDVGEVFDVGEVVVHDHDMSSRFHSWAPGKAFIFGQIACPTHSSRPLLAGACEKFFHMLEVNDVGMYVVIYFMGGDPPPAPIDGEGEVKGDNGDPPRSRLMVKVKSKMLMVSKSVAKPLLRSWLKNCQ